MKKKFLVLFSSCLIVISFSFREGQNNKVGNQTNTQKLLTDRTLFLSQFEDLSLVETTAKANAAKAAVLAEIEESVAISTLPEDVQSAWANRSQPMWYVFGTLIDVEICPGSGQPCRLGNNLAADNPSFNGMTKGKNKGDLLFIFSDGSTI